MIETTLKELEQDLNKIPDIKSKKINVNVNDADSKRVKTNKQFGLVFYSVLQDFIEAKQITLQDISVLFKIVELANQTDLRLIGINQAGLAEEMSIKKQSIYRSWKRLHELNILVKNKYGHWYYNPQVICTSSTKKVKDGEAYKISVDITRQEVIRDFKEYNLTEDEIEAEVKKRLSF